ncbi:two-component system response regulator YesN [Paenibacillus endophyticus]|uniref:Two-component system response regulator YesN n=1 Tax=Paenibacillus endophyticus TaxID=1294268 RepID=A0A7W5G8Z8_9BACL|nr:response regulator [Paenibacillus endophyticus]MBB3150432.1 two-component system response regulator YesN [Paenibacillus endophyticus]
MVKKVFFVDDEIVIRENIRDCINWEAEGFIYCGDAPDGEFALPLIEEHKPDILITDIKMPFMNGLELSAIVRMRLPDTKIILLSGHDEFEYARQALRIGIEDYCLKPLGAQDIVTLLRKVTDKIDKENAEKIKIEQLTRSLKDKAKFTQDQLLSQLCGGIIASAEAIELASTLNLSLIAKQYAVILTDIRLHTEDSNAEQNLINRIESEISALFNEFAEHLTSKRSRTETVWVLKSELKIRLQHLCEKIIDAVRLIEASYGCSISVGIGSIQDRLQGVHASFLEAEEDKYWRRLAEQHRTALFELSGSFDRELFLDRDGFIEFLSMGSPRQADAYIQQFVAGLAAIDWESSLFGYFSLNHLTFEVIRKARKLFRTALITEESIESLKRMIHSITSTDDARVYIAHLAELFWRWRSDSAGKYGELITQVKSFVQTSYGKDGLSLQDAADQVNVSPSHLSKVFSQETGQTFIEFLMNTRIRKAMELMQSTNAKSYEIANEVGYNDPHYFSNLFKRVTGMTIREFRKNGWQHDIPFGEGGTTSA